MVKPHKHSSDWRSGSKRRLIAELAESGKTKREAYSSLRPMVESQSEPMVFKANVSGRRIAKPISEQLIELKNEIGRVYALLGRAQSASWESEEIPAEEMQETEIPSDGCDSCGNVTELFYDEASGLSLCNDCLPTEEIKETEEESVSPVARGKARVKSELAHFLSEVRRIRAICEDRAASGSHLDSISMRPAQAAAKLIPAGIPSGALLHAMLLHWKPEIRRADAGIPDFDFIGLSGSIMKDRGIETAGKHELFGYVLTLAEERQPIMLVGPAGTGKSHLARQISEYLEIPYGETPMTPGATRGDLLGRMTANPEEPFILSQFAEIYSGGGVFNFEEIDAADPGMLLVLNNALAGSDLFNSSNGQRYERSADFVAISTANTFGIGANREFTGREKLDAATLDRWRMGRVFMPLDESVETALLYGNV